MPKGHYEHRNLIDMTGRQFNDWTVLSRVFREDDGYGTTLWLCRCVCGREKPVNGSTLRSGKSRGCGCRAAREFAKVNTKHGLSDTPEHRVWIAMRSRCSNPNTTKWNLYGARGITVDPRWEDFAVFLADMGPRPSPRHSIERRDGTKGYSPENCYWATPQQQNRNTSRNHYLTFDGETLTLAEWAERKGLSYGALSSRIAAQWPLDRALNSPQGRWASRIRE